MNIFLFNFNVSKLIIPKLFSINHKLKNHIKKY